MLCLLISCIIFLGMFELQVSTQDFVKENFLLVVADFEKRSRTNSYQLEKRSNVYQIDLQSGAMIPLLPPTTFNLAAVVFDPVERVVYWTDVSQRLIGKNSVDGPRESPKSIFTDTSGTVQLYGLAVDVKSRKLYCADGGNFSKIVEMNLDGSQQFTIFNETGMKPWDLVVDPEQRVLYYTDCGVQPGIYVIELSTYHRTAIVTDMAGVGKPTALAIDFEERVMYWGRSHRGIEMASLDGSRGVRLIKEETVDYFAIALSSQYLYITDVQTSSLRRLDKKTHIMLDQTPEVGLLSLGKVYGLAFYTSSVARVSSDTTVVWLWILWIVAIIAGALVSITAMIAVSVCYVTKRKRARLSAKLDHVTTTAHALTNSTEFTSHRSSEHYEYMLPSEYL